VKKLFIAVAAAFASTPGGVGGSVPSLATSFYVSIASRKTHSK